MKARVIVPIFCMNETYLTGSIVDVERANEHTFRMGDRYVSSTDLELLEPENNIDWEARRYNIAKDIVLSAATNIEYLTEMQKRGWEHTELAQQAVKYADALIEELRRDK